LFASEEQESSPFVAKHGDPFCYLAKYVTKQGGELWFGGTLSGVNFSEITKSGEPVGKMEIAKSCELPWQMFHMNYKGRKR
jgi:hypothetical protein